MYGSVNEGRENVIDGSGRRESGMRGCGRQQCVDSGNVDDGVEGVEGEVSETWGGILFGQALEVVVEKRRKGRKLQEDRAKDDAEEELIEVETCRGGIYWQGCCWHQAFGECGHVIGCGAEMAHRFHTRAFVTPAKCRNTVIYWAFPIPEKQ